MSNLIRIFKDKRKLNSMLAFRRQGWTYKSLAMVFGVDHSSIYNACKIRGIPNPEYTISLNPSSIISLFDIQVPHEKTYKEYLEEQRRRRFPKLYSLTISYN